MKKRLTAIILGIMCCVLAFSLCACNTATNDPQTLADDDTDVPYKLMLNCYNDTTFSLVKNSVDPFVNAFLACSKRDLTDNGTEDALSIFDDKYDDNFFENKAVVCIDVVFPTYNAPAFVESVTECGATVKVDVQSSEEIPVSDALTEYSFMLEVDKADISGATSVSVEIIKKGKINNYIFNEAQGRYYYSVGRFYRLSELYSQSLLTEEQIKSIAYYYYDGEGIEGQPIAKDPQELDAITEEKIIQTYVSYYNTVLGEAHRLSQDDIDHINVSRYFGTYSGYVAVMMADGFGHFCVTGSETVADITFNYGYADITIMLWKEN